MSSPIKTSGGSSVLLERGINIKQLLLNKRQQSRKKDFCEFFAGIGLVRAGLIASGWNCVYSNDIDPKKYEMYERQFGASEHFHLEDIWKTDEVVSKITEAPFLATASFPCTDLSLAGRGRGFKGKHSSTFFGFVKVIDSLKERRPKLVMLENVTGFITSHGGSEFTSAVKALADLGYWIDAFVLDAKFFVPQSRPRVFVIGLHKSQDCSSVTRQSSIDSLVNPWMDIIDRRPSALRPDPLLHLMQTIRLSTGWMAFELEQPNQKRSKLEDLIDLDNNQEWWDEQMVSKHYDMMSDLHRNRVDALLAEKGIHVGTIYRRKRHDRTYAEVRLDGVAGCLRTPRGGSARQIIVVITKGKLRMRWMSPREYARLQGADNFQLVEHSNQNLFGFGDAVCVPAIAWIDQNILSPIFELAS
ncbi:MAG: DNA (cytosine-5-)-methyltransferase [Candidatus Peribacteraceae bacterium]|nr:DNA (cytosine-5-)-methyltransferase [Candidatus Peribacteraceae bacterium]